MSEYELWPGHKGLVAPKSTALRQVLTQRNAEWMAKRNQILLVRDSKVVLYREYDSDKYGAMRLGMVVRYKGGSAFKDGGLLWVQEIAEDTVNCTQPPRISGVIRTHIQTRIENIYGSV